MSGDKSNEPTSETILVALTVYVNWNSLSSLLCEKVEITE